MRTLILLSLICIASISCFSQTVKKYDIKDTHALNEVAEKWKLYWNSHDMDSFASLFANDIDFVTKSGTWIQGKEETVKHHKKNHATIFKTSTWITDSVAIKYVKADVAIIHIGWGLSGDLHHDGTPSSARHGISTWVLTKENEQWLLLAVHNVNIEAAR